MQRTDEQGTVWVTIQHPATGGEAEVPEDAYEEVYEGLGWVLAPDTADEAPVDPASIPTPEPVSTGTEIQEEDPHG